MWLTSPDTIPAKLAESEPSLVSRHRPWGHPKPAALGTARRSGRDSPAPAMLWSLCGTQLRPPPHLGTSLGVEGTS